MVPFERKKINCFLLVGVSDATLSLVCGKCWQLGSVSLLTVGCFGILF